MAQIAEYYVTLKPTHDKGRNADGMHHIAFVDDPAIEEIGIYLNKHDARIVADETIQAAIIEHLKNCGQELPKHWKEVSDDEFRESVGIELTTDPLARTSFNDYPNPKGGGQWLVRYRYEGPKDDRNREFCSQILSIGRIYTEEEIKNGLSNPEFGNYSIFDYKGSYGCRHVWRRQIYYEDYEDDEVRKVGNVLYVSRKLDDSDARTLNKFLSKDEKMQVVAPLLIPEKRVFRNDELGQYNMIFTAETIAELRSIAEQKGVLMSTNLFKDTHQGGVAPSYILDEWVVSSSDDKAYTEYGFSPQRVPLGTWMVHSQITDRDFWEKEIKLNKKHAYSIEALINLSIIKMQKMAETTEKVVLPDGEHLINGTIYVVQGGEVVSTKAVTEQQEDVIEEVAEEAIETMSATPKKEETTPVTAMETVAPTPAAPAAEEDRLSKLESQMGEMVTEIASLRAQLEMPAPTDVDVKMEKARPIWQTLAALRNSSRV